MFKKIAFGCLLIFLLSLVSVAQSVVSEKIEAYIKQLEGKLLEAQKAKDFKRVKRLEEMIKEQRARLTATKEEGKKEIKGSDLEEKLTEHKEEINTALAELKRQIDKVADENKDAKVGGVVFFRWQKYTSNGTVPNNFDVDRAYVDLKKKLSWDASVRMTLDVARISGASRQNLFDYLKYAYFEVPLNVSALQIVPWSLTAKVGLQHTVWIDWADKILNLRYIAKSLVDNEGVMSSADFGVGALGKIAVGLLPEVEYHATVLNGSGYGTFEGNGQKAVALRINAIPFEGREMGKVIVGIFGNVESLDSSLSLNKSNKQAGLAIAYKHDLGTASLEYLLGSKSNKKINGYSVGAIFNLGSAVGFLPNLNLFVRMDQYDPDINTANNERKKSFYGITYDWGKDIRLAIDMQTAQTGSGTTTSILYAHSSVTF